MQHDLLEPFFRDFPDNHLIAVGPGRNVYGLHVYDGGRGGPHGEGNGGQWFIDYDHVREGDAQEGKTPHLRTGAAGASLPGDAKYHRSFFSPHFIEPDVHVTFRIEEWNPSGLYSGEGRDNLGFKIAVGHQSNLVNTFVSLKYDGTASIFNENRDEADYSDKAPYGRTLATGKWNPDPLVRHHLALLGTGGALRVMLNGEIIMISTDRVRQGQVAFRLDGVDCTIHSLVVRTF